MIPPSAPPIETDSNRVGDKSFKILRVLSNAFPLLLKVSDVEAGAEYSKQTVCGSIKKLIKLKLADRPLGPRKGTGITIKGRDLFKN